MRQTVERVRELRERQDQAAGFLFVMWLVAVTVFLITGWEWLIGMTVGCIVGMLACVWASAPLRG